MKAGFPEVIKIILATIPFVVMSLYSSKINLKRELRGHQFLLPFFALFYCFPTMFLVDRIALFLIKLVRLFASIFNIVPFIGPKLSYIFNFLYSKLQMGYGIQLLCNTVIMLVFCGLKKAVLPLVNKWWRKWKALYELSTAHFYDELGEQSVLKKRFANMRSMFNAIYYTTIVLGAFDCVCVLVFRDNDVLKFPFYPVFSIIVIGEISFFLNGMTYGEGSFVEIEEETTTVDIDASRLRKELKRKFGDRICLDDEVLGERSRIFQGHDWLTGIAPDDDLGRVAGAYFNTLENAGRDINPDYVSATRKLLHQNSVLIYNPFYSDLTDYLILPIFHALLNHNSCLVICGRMTDEDDIIKWLKDGIANVTNLPKLWKIENLISLPDSGIPDIGVLNFENLYDIDNLKANKSFYEKTSFVIMLEPSNLLGTGQIGVRSIIQNCEQQNKNITYCILDRNVDGLIDTLSHVVRQSITEVVASPVSGDAYNRIFWKADGPGLQTRILPRISHYLGIGTEIACLAMHEGVNDIDWYSGSKMPLLDLKWNVEQYYQSVCQYIHSSMLQSEMDSKFHFHQNLWQADFKGNSFLIIEDEFNNVFELSRAFAARIKKNGFVNILSENYMLRDYMCDNSELFTNDPKAIPSIVPDYAQTQRNFVLKTIMLMAISPVDESVLSRELSLYGCETKNTYQKLCELMEIHLGVKDFHIQTLREYVGVGGNRYSKFSYQVDKSLVESVFDAALKSAYYVVENEKLETYPMGNRLMGHIEQVILPGQYFCYGGKYYQVRTISAKNGIIVRRAADHLERRVYYRQIRDYSLNVLSEDENIQNIRGMELQSICADIQVKTPGYLELKSRNLLTDAINVSLNPARKRNIEHKEVLRVSIPNVSDNIRYTLCILLNELFYTVFPNENGYIAVTSDILPTVSSESKENTAIMGSLVPSLVIDKISDGSIYFIEDSCIDLGLLAAIERNFQRFFEILFDYLDWYLGSKKMPEEGESNESEKDNSDREEYSKQLKFNKEAVNDVEGEDEELLNSASSIKTWKSKMPYLTYGFDEAPSWLDVEGTYEFLKEKCFNDSNIHRSRKSPPEFDEGSNYDPNQPGVHYCDFCGRPLEKGAYEVLKDGRERCSECGKDAIKTRKQFKEIYKETLTEMERVFGISIDCPVQVRMVNARKVNDIPGVEFVPTPHSDSRVLGYAQKAQDGYKLLVENGAPRWKMKSTLVHELSHIWQFLNWGEEELQKVYPDEISCNIAMEGMAVWVELQYLMAMGQKERAIMYKRNRDIDTSIYGVGMKRFIEKYPIKEVSNVAQRKTPFKKFPPI